MATISPTSGPANLARIRLALALLAALPAAVLAEYVVQVGAYVNPANADAMAARMERAGYPANIQSDSYDSFVRVLIGPYDSRGQANTTKNRLRNQGWKGFVKRYDGPAFAGEQNRDYESGVTDGTPRPLFAKDAGVVTEVPARAVVHEVQPVSTERPAAETGQRYAQPIFVTPSTGGVSGRQAEKPLGEPQPIFAD